MISAHITQPLTEAQQAARASMERQLAPRFKNVYCSQCGEDFGAGSSGYSHCESHAGVPTAHAIDHAMLAHKNSDPFNQRGADRTMAREIALRAATGMVA